MNISESEFQKWNGIEIKENLQGRKKIWGRKIYFMSNKVTFGWLSVQMLLYPEIYIQFGKINFFLCLFMSDNKEARELFLFFNQLFGKGQNK